MNDSSHVPTPAAGGAGLNQRLLSSLEALSRGSSYLIALVGLAVLLGWQFDIELLRAGLPGRAPVNPATALALLLAAWRRVRKLLIQHFSARHVEAKRIARQELIDMVKRHGAKSNAANVAVHRLKNVIDDDNGEWKLRGLGREKAEALLKRLPGKAS
jgi:hypothetical protein